MKNQLPVYLLLFALLAIPTPSQAFFGVKVVKKPESKQELLQKQRIGVLPITSRNVDFGKINKKRLPKIKALLARMKKRLRKQWVEGMRKAKASKKFYYSLGPGSKNVLVKINIDEFKNGNMAARKFAPIGFAGKSKVKMTAQILDARTKKVLTEFSATQKDKGGMIAGGLDAEVLTSSSLKANHKIFKHTAKLLNVKYKRFSNVGEGIKESGKHYKKDLEEEKRELKK